MKNTPPEQIDALIENVADLQKQVLRRFAQSILEEMHFHLMIAREKCQMFEEDNLQLHREIQELRNQICMQKVKS